MASSVNKGRPSKPRQKKRVRFDLSDTDTGSSNKNANRPRTPSTTTEYPRKIPKIIHQIWFDFSGTGKGQTPPQSYLNLQKKLLLNHQNQGYSFYQWDENAVEDLIHTHYAQFWKVYENLHRPIEKVDMARFFILHYYGGIYIDMDTESITSIDEFFNDFKKARDANIILCPTPQIVRGVTNAVMFSVPNHPFWIYCLEKIKQKWIPLWTYALKSIYILHSCGPGLIWRAYKKYKQSNDVSDIWVPQKRIILHADRKSSKYLFHESHVTWVTAGDVLASPLSVVLYIVLAVAFIKIIKKK